MFESKAVEGATRDVNRKLYLMNRVLLYELGAVGGEIRELRDNSTEMLQASRNRTYIISVKN